MATRESIETLMTEANQRVEEARDQLDEANRMGFQMTSDYTDAQVHLEEIEVKINKLMHSANHQQKEQLHRLHLLVSQCMNDMILDNQDLTQYEG
ncbi:hypothetical protein N781_07340 [Pontibacillus halophilus JSM 076056 = DSM 19796]|uniref:DUF2524 domain-containing protein n=2 Tax=Pontibacillus TaxID=289201 RepID=A0A0A5GEG7_9BACI|nr:DUF2524 family protein [Pontibacillus halophilus]KGX89500.1 hypothetical protein N781_07340 [Pontibacillus halophilus JSM 076056 = DSM 19796]